jgi:hypothetical protein
MLPDGPLSGMITPPWQVVGKQQGDKAERVHFAPCGRHVAAHTPSVDPELEAQNVEQHAAAVSHADAFGRHVLTSDPASTGAQQALSCCPQLFTQLVVLEHPLIVQHVPVLVQTSPEGQLHACDTPQESATETPHAAPHMLVGVQHLPFAHSWALPHPPVHCTASPQLSVACEPPQRLAQGDTGVQHALS